MTVLTPEQESFLRLWRKMGHKLIKFIKTSNSKAGSIVQQMDESLAQAIHADVFFSLPSVRTDLLLHVLTLMCSHKGGEFLIKETLKVNHMCTEMITGAKNGRLLQEGLSS